MTDQERIDAMVQAAYALIQAPSMVVALFLIVGAIIAIWTHR